MARFWPGLPNRLATNLLTQSMTKVLNSHGILVLALVLGTGACAAKAPTAGPSSGARPASLDSIDALYRARTDSLRMRFTPADARFMTGMIGHHAQALVMSRMAPTHGASPSIQTLAGRIINAQQDEIGLMQQWLRERGQPVPEVHIEGTNLMIHGGDHGLMPGMLTPEQIKQLDQARGADFDRLFLTFMIQHHRGAVSMVHELFASPGAGQDDVAFKLASDVQVDQITEIDRMEKMLAALRSTR